MSDPKLTKNEVLAVLHAIEWREITLETDTPPAEVYAGDCLYKASNGWTLVVFNDCGEWDYLSSAEAPDGRKWEFDDGNLDYRGPVNEPECYRLWGIPPYLSTPEGEPWLRTLPEDAEVSFRRPKDIEVSLAWYELIGALAHYRQLTGGELTREDIKFLKSHEIETPEEDPDSKQGLD